MDSITQKDSSSLVRPVVHAASIIKASSTIWRCVKNSRNRMGSLSVKNKITLVKAKMSPMGKGSDVIIPCSQKMLGLLARSVFTCQIQDIDPRVESFPWEMMVGGATCKMINTKRRVQAGASKSARVQKILCRRAGYYIQAHNETHLAVGVPEPFVNLL